MRTAEKDNVAEAIDHVLREVRAARRDLHMTGFCLQQSEAFRKIDRAKASLLDLVQSRNHKNKPTGVCPSASDQVDQQHDEHSAPIAKRSRRISMLILRAIRSITLRKRTRLIPAKIRPDIGPALAAGRADEAVLDVR